jgi:hypothetical protein
MGLVLQVQYREQILIDCGDRVDVVYEVILERYGELKSLVVLHQCVEDQDGCLQTQ